jgi:hypothetical protein
MPSFQQLNQHNQPTVPPIIIFDLYVAKSFADSRYGPVKSLPAQGKY